MKRGNNDASSLETAKETLTSENEESDSNTDQSSSTSDSIRKKCRKSPTQFSVVQRSDTDGIRMKISAIRTTASLTTVPAGQNKKGNKSFNIVNGENNNLDPVRTAALKLKQKSCPNSSIKNKPDSMREDTSAVNIEDKLTCSACKSDESESGLSEATTTTTTTTMATTKKIKVKRKKVQLKGNDTKKSAGNIAVNSKTSNDILAHSSDSEMDTKTSQSKISAIATTSSLAMSMANNKRKLVSLNSVSGSTGIPDNIGLSSSDNELPALVNAAIKCVESNSDSENEKKSVPTDLPPNLYQYQSSLLQDFMEKTQMLGQPVKILSANSTTLKKSQLEESSDATLDNLSNSRQLLQKKRRGRPRKSLSIMTQASTPTGKIPSPNIISESADSGVISTTSTAQSISPSPKSSSMLKKPSEADLISSFQPPVPVNKPKIDIVSLDKRMYATERVLYPPPRNKRKQFLAATKEKALQLSLKATKICKDELIDPLWRKIDVNKKFRRPSLAGYKSDGGGNTICSKVLVAKSGYVSDYISVYARNRRYSGYKSDASGKSRYSARSCISRAKSCGFRSDCSTAGIPTTKSSKFRRKRRCSLMKHHSKSVGNVNEQDILQLAGLSLGQSSEESSEYGCKPSLTSLPTTLSKKYGEINRFIATGEYFGRGKNRGDNLEDASQYKCSNLLGSFTKAIKEPSKMGLRQKNILDSELTHELMPSHSLKKIKSRRSSVASYCSSYYSGFSKIKRRRRRKSFRYSSSNKSCIVDSKLLTEIEIITNTFGSMCRIQCEKSTFSKEKEKSERIGGDNSKGAPQKSRENRDKRTQKKRKLSEIVDLNLMNSSTTLSASKRRHKKTCSSSPDDHKLPLKKRHYLLSGREKSSEGSLGKLHAVNSLELTNPLYPGKGHREVTASCIHTTNQAQQKPSAKLSSKAAVTPKKRHLQQTSQQQHQVSTTQAGEDLISASIITSVKNNQSSPLRISFETAAASSSMSTTTLASLKQVDRNPLPKTSENVNKKRSRLEGLVNKIASHCDSPVSSSVALLSFASTNSISPVKETSNVSAVNVTETSVCPPPGVFEPSVELEIQIPPISTKLSENVVITKSEVDSPLDLLELNKPFQESAKVEARVVESLLNKTGANQILKRKRKKINRTGFPTTKKKKRKLRDSSTIDVEVVNNKEEVSNRGVEKMCDRVPHTGEASHIFLERANRTPRLSVVSLERLQGTSSKKRTDRTEEKDFSTVSTMSPSPSLSTFKLRVKSESNNSKQKHLPVDAAAVVSKTRERRIEAKNSSTTQNKTMVGKRRQAQPVGQLGKNGKTIVMDTKLKETIKVLPVGIDPNTNFSCKIRLKRRSSFYPNHAPEAKRGSVAVSKDCVHSKKDELAAGPAESESCDHLEQDILPLNEGPKLDSDSAISDTSEEKSLVSRKSTKWKKTYLQAGLLSDFFKVASLTKTSAAQNKKNAALVAASSKENHESIEATAGGAVAQKLLPPPPYCEKFFRRTQLDFLLPYDIWWAYMNSKLPARVTVPSWNYRKIRTNVYAESVRPNTAGIDHPTCNCKVDVGCSDECLNRMVYTECSPSSCPTREKCRNQKIQRHEVAPGVERFMTENKGWGVRTKLPIKKGTYILEYVGEVVTEKEFKERMATMYSNDTHHYCLHLDGGLVIDGHRMGSDGRFVNHSCLPNCEMQKWSVNGLSRMALFAARNIEIGEELSYDYNFSLFNPSEGQPCRCNTPQCRGVIGGKSQRVKPLAIEPKLTESSNKDGRKGRQRKRQARKNTARLQSRDIVVARLQHLSDKEKKVIRSQRIFLTRNFEKIRRLKTKENRDDSTSATSSFTLAKTSTENVYRRPSTPTSLAAQISALRSPRNIKTRGLALAVYDQEVEKMAKMAVILREMCVDLENIKDHDGKTLISKVFFDVIKKKKKGKQPANITKPIGFNTVQSNIEKGFYQNPSAFDADMMRTFAASRQQCGDDEVKLSTLKTLKEAYQTKKHEIYCQLAELVDKESLVNFKLFVPEDVPGISQDAEQTRSSLAPLEVTGSEVKSTEDIIACICGLYKDEGLMIQCFRCMVWQHTECTKADVNADNYLCEKCEPRAVDREITLDDFTEDGYRYYLSLMRGDLLQIRQGDTVYVLRDIPFKDNDGKICPTKKHTYETIGVIDYNECDIFRVERLWKNHDGKRFIFGHHFLRPHETFHEPTRRFYPNEVVRVPLYEVVPIELVIGRCWVLDRTTFCKGRPIDCTLEDHVYICELRVDKTARFFSKAKITYPTCTKNYAFKKFQEKLKISKTYAPHDVDPSLLKTKKQKTEAEPASKANMVPSQATLSENISRLEDKTPLASTMTTTSVSVKRKQKKQKVTVKTLKTTIKQKRIRLEKVLNAMKLYSKNTQMANEPALDLSYLLSGRGARLRKTAAVIVPTVLNKNDG